MKATVYHLRDEFFPPMRKDLGERQIELKKYDCVASVELIGTYPVDSFLDIAYEHTNSIFHHWSKNSTVVCPKPNARSTSVGDVFRIAGYGWYRVDSFGFTQVELV